MEHQLAKAFLEAAQSGYVDAVSDFIDYPDRKALRRDVLEAQAVLDLAQREFDDARRHVQAGKDYTGVCDECGRTAPRWVVGSGVDLRALCAECEKKEQG